MHPERLSGGQYSLYRGLLGGYLLVHFVHLLPWAAEVFGRGGLVAEPGLSPLMAALPAALHALDAPALLIALIGLGACGGVLIALGWFDRSAAIGCALLLAWLHARNPLIANPSLPLLGWLLLAHACTPPRPHGSLASLRGGVEVEWQLPAAIYWSAFIVLAVSYSYSGYTKLLSPGWVAGEAIAEVLHNPLARDHALRALLLALPPVCLQWLTWLVIAVELLFAPLALWRRLRFPLWLSMLLIQFGFLVFLDFADLTAPMLLAHLLTFDPRWIRPAAPAQLLFDGQCGFCHGLVRFALIEDTRQRLRFASLQSQGHTDDSSIVLIDSSGSEWRRSDAVIGVLRRLGGYWWLLAQALRAVPRALRDAGYDAVGRLRYRLGARLATDACPRLPPALVQRMQQAPAAGRPAK